MPVHSRAARLRRVVPAALAGVCLALLGAATPASASIFPLTETFENSTSAFSGLGAVGNSAALTGGGIDPEGQGWLRLTPASTNRVGYAFYDTAFPTAKGFVASFDYAMYGGTVRGADGIMVGLYDGTTSASAFRIGGDGGRLGYGSCNTTPGLENAVLGVGIDLFGHFAGENTCMANAPTRVADAVTLLGPAPDYHLIATTHVTPTLAADRQSTVRATVSSLGDGKVSVRLQRPDGTIQTPIVDAAIPGTIPPTLKLVVAATTGSLTNIQEVRGVRVTEALDYVMAVSDGVASAPRASARVWTVDVANDGPAASTGQDVTMTSSQPLDDVSWVCTASGGAVCQTTAGSGLPDGVSSGAMPAGSKLTYTVTGTPGASADHAQLTATVSGTTAAATDPNLANNTADDDTALLDDPHDGPTDPAEPPTDGDATDHGSGGDPGSGDPGAGGSDGGAGGLPPVAPPGTAPACSSLPLAVTNAVKAGRNVRVEGLYLSGSDRVVTLYLGKRKVKTVTADKYGVFSSSFAMTRAESRRFRRSSNAMRVTGRTRGNRSKSLKLSRQFANKDLKPSGSQVVVSGTLAPGFRAAGVKTVMLSTKSSCSGEGRWVKTKAKATIVGRTITVSAPRPRGPVRADGTITTFYRIQVNIRRVGASKKSKGAKTYTLPRRLLLVAR